MQGLSSVGKRIPKIDAVDKATGRAQYIQDLKLPGMLYGKILYSKFPHARIVKIDTSKARALPGVRAVITGEDIPEIKMGVYKDNRPLKAGKVRSYRDEVAAVAATDPQIAQEQIRRAPARHHRRRRPRDGLDAGGARPKNIHRRKRGRTGAPGRRRQAPPVGLRARIRACRVPTLQSWSTAKPSAYPPNAPWKACSHSCR